MRIQPKEGTRVKEEREYLVPDYFEHFTCKMGSCRAACCVGWPISFSLKDYYRLLGMECSPDLRRRLDGAMHIKLHPTPESYAEISPRFDGNCPLRMDDGRCWLHAEMGEEVLSSVCRLYPRGARLDGASECSCANSCEGVLELLFSRDEPIAFEKRMLALELPDSSEREVHFETLGRAQEIRLWLIRQMQQQALPLPQRLMAMGHALWALDEALAERDEHQVQRLLLGQRRIRPLQPQELAQGQLNFGLEVARGMLALLDERSVSIREYGEAALAYFGEDEGSFQRYARARAHFETAYPKWDIWFEHMLVNHMFFVQFPFQDRPESLRDEFVALCAVYALLRFLGIGWLWDKTETSDFVDVAAAAFRLIDHTAFDRYAAHMLKRLGCDDWEKIHDLISL